MAGLLKMVVGLAFLALLAGQIVSRSPLAGAPNAAAAKPSPIAAAPAPAPALGYGAVMLRADPRGHFLAEVEIEGVRTPVMVDTGATLVALSYEDAARLGRAPSESDYTWVAQTANGLARNAPLTFREIRLGSLVAHDVQGVVLPRGVEGRALLGMSFLKQFRFASEGGALVLRP